MHVCVLADGVSAPGIDGRMHVHSQPDYAEAHQWALRAMQWGETDAAYTLGQIYEMGHGVPADHLLAIHWYLTCIQAKDVKDDGDHRAKFKAMNALGRCYYKGGLHDAAESKVDPDYAKAMYWWQRAANEGKNADAMNHIGDLYYRGRGVAKDNAKAKEWWQKAADLGHAEAVHGLDRFAPKSFGDKLKLWLPMIILALMLLAVGLVERERQRGREGGREGVCVCVCVCVCRVLARSCLLTMNVCAQVLCYFGYKYHEMANDSWFQRNSAASDDQASSTADTTAASPPPPPPSADAGAGGDKGSGAGSGAGADTGAQTGTGSGSGAAGGEL